MVDDSVNRFDPLWLVGGGNCLKFRLTSVGAAVRVHAGPIFSIPWSGDRGIFMPCAQQTPLLTPLYSGDDLGLGDSGGYARMAKVQTRPIQEETIGTPPDEMRIESCTKEAS